MPEQPSAIVVVDVLDGLEHALAAVALLVAVAQLQGLVRAGGGAGGHRGAAQGAVLEHDLDLDGRVAARIEDLPAQDMDDRGVHMMTPLNRLFLEDKPKAQPAIMPEIPEEASRGGRGRCRRLLTLNA